MSDNLVNGFHSGSFCSSKGHSIRYRFFAPPGTENTRFPLIVHLHGAGSWTPDDNTVQLGNASRLVREEFPAFILAPQTLQPMKWADLDWTQTRHTQSSDPLPSLHAVMELVRFLIRETPSIDPARVYANGQSMGGYGTWDMILRWPELFAAAVPVCGGADVSQVGRIRNLPLWVFHGALDEVVPVENSRSLVDALRAAGNTRVRYTEFPDVYHDAWIRAYDDPDHQLFSWLFSQSRAAEPV